MAGMLGAPIQFTNPVGTASNPGLLGPSNMGLLGGIAQGLQSALDSYRDERRYGDEMKQRQLENQMKQNQFGLQEFNAGVTQDDTGKFQYSPEKLAMLADQRDYETAQENKKQQQGLLGEIIKANGDPKSIFSQTDITGMFTPAQYTGSHMAALRQQQVPSPDSDSQSDSSNPGGGLLNAAGQSSPQKWNVPFSSAQGEQQAEEQYGANNSGPAPSGNAPPAFSPNLAGLSSSPGIIKAKADAQNAVLSGQKTQGEINLQNINLNDPLTKAGPERKEQATPIVKSFQDNQASEKQLNDANAILNDPKQTMIAKADAVQTAIRLLMDKSGSTGVRMTQKELDNANDLVKVFRTNPLDAGIGPDIKNQVQIFQNKINDLHSSATAQKSQYSTLIPGGNLVDMPMEASPSNGLLKQGGGKPSRVMQNGHTYILNPSTGKYE